MDQIKTSPQSFFMPIANTKPYFKAALEGFAGTGKTYTAAQLAIGLHHRIGSKKPVVIFDTEKAAKFLRSLFASAGIQVLLRESRSLADLKMTMQMMRNEKISDILIIDSISHVWEGFLQSYQEKVRRSSLQFQDWGVIKPTWKAEFSNPFVNDPYHVIMCGRAGYEYENEVNSETGKREIFKSGVKMKVEGETAYEPDMLVLMERFEKVLGEDKQVWREATVLKDRSTILDGKTFKNPSYNDFAPAIEAMLADPFSLKEGESIVPEGNTQLLFRTEEDKAEWRRSRDKALEEIEGLLVSVAPGQTSNEKKFKVDILHATFGTASWTAIGELSPDTLRGGYLEIVDKLIAEGLVMYRENNTIAALKKVEAKDVPEVPATPPPTAPKRGKVSK